jgi:uncharacterized protein (TIGR04255 family)
MARIRHLEKAPIAEAVIDLRVQPSDGVSADSFSAATAELKPRYPVVEPIESVAATFGIQEGKPSAPDTTYERLGLFFKTADGRNVVQFRTNGFTFSRLPQYTSWEQMFPEMLTLWERYRRIARPVRVTRVAVRYINRLHLPLPVDLPVYLTAPPVVPESFPAVIRAYLTRLILNDTESGDSVIVTQALERSVDSDHLVVLLDVDAYRDVEIEPDDDRMQSILGRLRDLKNRVFFGSITERTAEMYE